MLPAENSLTGNIGEVYGLLVEHELTITGETVVPVEQCLLVLPGAVPGGIKRVISHPQALAQCSAYIERTSFDTVPFHETAGTAKHIAAKRLSATAAIASGSAADIYGLEIVERGIQRRPDNLTRFFRVEKLPGPAGLRNKNVFAIRLENVVRPLQSFAVNEHDREARQGRC